MVGVLVDPPDVEVVLVARERYRPTVDGVRAVLDTIGADVRLTVVRGGMPRRVLRQLRGLDDPRLRIVGPGRHLAPNAARRLGFALTRARFVAFVDNDVVPEPGWLDALVRTAEATGAWAVRPLVLQRLGDVVTVHDAGGDCRIEERDGHRVLVESHRLLGLPPAAASVLGREQVELFEFHAVVFDRARLVALGGPDERMRSQGEHLDLALRLLASGGSIWLEPSVRVTYQIPEWLPPRDLVFFLGRWSPTWNRTSRQAFDAAHGIDDPDDVSFTWRYADLHRSYAWLPATKRLVGLVGGSSGRHAAVVVDRVVGRRLAELVRRVAPRWRGDGVLSG
jgi:hypothetical protein